MSETVTSPRPARAGRGAGEPLMEVRDLVKHFPLTSGIIFQRKVGAVQAVDGISFDVLRGETLGLVGRVGLRQVDHRAAAAAPDGPDVGLDPLRGPGDRGRSTATRLKTLRQDMQMIFQDPYSSLNPRKTVGTIIGEPFAIQGMHTGEGERKKTVQELMDIVGLNPEHYNRYPHEFSGGQRQRIGVARALALKPKLIIADEPVSALDVSIQAQILNLLRELQRDLGITLVFIAHDLSVVRHMCDRVAVMYLGRIVEMASSDELYAHPRMPYTGALMSAVPVADPRLAAAEEAPGAGRRRAVADQPAAGVPLPHPLLEGAGDLPQRGPAAGGQGGRQRRRLPLPAHGRRGRRAGPDVPRQAPAGLAAGAATAHAAAARAVLELAADQRRGDAAGAAADHDADAVVAALGELARPPA